MPRSRRARGAVTGSVWPVARTPAAFASEAELLGGESGPFDPRVEAAEVLPLDRLGTTDDCGFSPFADDTSTSRDVAFDKIGARVEGTRLASEQLGL